MYATWILWPHLKVGCALVWHNMDKANFRATRKEGRIMSCECSGSVICEQCTVVRGSSWKWDDSPTLSTASLLMTIAQPKATISSWQVKLHVVMLWNLDNNDKTAQTILARSELRKNASSRAIWCKCLEYASGVSRGAREPPPLTMYSSVCR